MATLTVRDVPEEAVVRAKLEDAVKPRGRGRLGTLLAEVGRQAKLSQEEIGTLERVRDKRPASRVSFR